MVRRGDEGAAEEVAALCAVVAGGLDGFVARELAVDASVAAVEGAAEEVAALCAVVAGGLDGLAARGVDVDE